MGMTKKMEFALSLAPKQSLPDLPGRVRLPKLFPTVTPGCGVKDEFQVSMVRNRGFFPHQEHSWPEALS